MMLFDAKLALFRDLAITTPRDLDKSIVSSKRLENTTHMRLMMWLYYACQH